MTKGDRINAWNIICYCCSCSDVDYPTKELDMISDVLIAYEELQAINTKTSDKYSWHDLRKNPTDIPTDSGDYLCCVEFREEYYSEKLENEYCVVEWHNGKWYTGETIYYGIDVIAWREIERFEVSE